MRSIRNPCIAAAITIVTMTALGTLDPRPANAGLDGAGLFARYCALCHSTDGSGYATGRAPAITNPEFLAAATELFVLHAIEHGRPKTPMSAWGFSHSGPLAATQTMAIEQFLRTHQTEPTIEFDVEAIEGKLATGRSLFSKHCAGCHGTRGIGGTALSLDNPTFLSSVFDAYLEHVIRSGRQGTPMRAYANQLSEGEIRDLVVCVRSWSRSLPQPPRLLSSPRDYVRNPEGPSPGFAGGTQIISAQTLQTALDRGSKLVLVDARAKSDWRRMHILGAIPIPFYDVDDLQVKWSGVPKDGTWIVCYCASPTAAAELVASAFVQAGYPNVVVLDEGVLSWQEQGHAVEINEIPPPPL